MSRFFFGPDVPRLLGWEVFYQFQVHPSGLRDFPWVFLRLLPTVVAFLFQEGIRIFYSSHISCWWRSQGFGWIPPSDYLNRISGPGFRLTVWEYSRTHIEIWNDTGAERTRFCVKHSTILTGVFSSPLTISRILTNLSLLFRCRITSSVPELDLLDSVLTFQPPRFCSRAQDPEVWAIDALSFPWVGLKLYAYSRIFCL